MKKGKTCRLRMYEDDSREELLKVKSRWATNKLLRQHQETYFFNDLIY